MQKKSKREPLLYSRLDSYEKKRYQIASAALLKRFMKERWKEGHVKLLSVFVWCYEVEGKKRLKFNREIRKYGFSGSYNYWFLPGLAKADIIKQEYGHGYYHLTEKSVKLLDKVIKILKQIDRA